MRQSIEGIRHKSSQMLKAQPLADLMAVSLGEFRAAHNLDRLAYLRALDDIVCNMTTVISRDACRRKGLARVKSWARIHWRLCHEQIQ